MLVVRKEEANPRYEQSIVSRSPETPHFSANQQRPIYTNQGFYEPNGNQVGLNIQRMYEDSIRCENRMIRNFEDQINARKREHEEAINKGKENTQLECQRIFDQSRLNSEHYREQLNQLESEQNARMTDHSRKITAEIEELVRDTRQTCKKFTEKEQKQLIAQISNYVPEILHRKSSKVMREFLTESQMNEDPSNDTPHSFNDYLFDPEADANELYNLIRVYVSISQQKKVKALILGFYLNREKKPGLFARIDQWFSKS